MWRRMAVWGLLTLVGCVDVAAPEGTDPTETTDGKGDGPAAPSLPGQIRRLELDYAGVPSAPGQPNLIAYLPSHLDTTQEVNVIIYLHGWYNCAENLLRATNGACVKGRPAREAYDLPGQLERSGKNAILLIPELAFDAAVSKPWGFETPNQFICMVWDALNRMDLSIWDVSQTIIVSHSGGYKAAAAILRDGGGWVNEVWLLDSLYGEDAAFEGWMNEDPSLLASLQRRFVSIYSLAGGTLAENQGMAGRLKDTFEAGVLLDDRAPGGVDAAIGAHGVVFKRSNLLHDPLVRTVFGQLLATSRLPDVTTP